MSSAGRLLEWLGAVDGTAIVAFSGGVDSTVVAKAATLALGGGRVRCITAQSESTTAEDIALCRDIAAAHGFSHEVIAYSELAIPGYAANPANRCYFCKSELYVRLRAIAAERGVAAILDGTNLDDLGDHRPGMKALEEQAIRSPLRECGLRKADVRELARAWGLPNHDRPAAPCLSSRVPYGQAITAEKLAQIARAEAFLRGLGLREFRCRHHGDVARLEVLPEDMPAIAEHRDAIVAELRRIGFQWVAMDLAGFRSGSLNRVLPTE